MDSNNVSPGQDRWNREDAQLTIEAKVLRQTDQTHEACHGRGSHLLLTRAATNQQAATAATAAEEAKITW